MTNTATVRKGLVLAMAMIMVHMEGVTAHSRHRGWLASCDSSPYDSRSLCYPRRRRNRYRRHRDAIDLVSDIFSMPFYTTANSLFRQSQRTALANRLPLKGPTYEITENEDGTEVQLTMEIPGVTAKDLTVEVEDGNLLRIHGKRRTAQEEEDEEGQITSSYIHKYSFDQAFRLGDNIDWEKMSVSLSAGILTVKAPKRVPVTRRIPISINEEEPDAQLPSHETEKEIPVQEQANQRHENEKQMDAGLEISKEEDSWQ